MSALQFDLDCDLGLTLTANAGTGALSAQKDLYTSLLSTRRVRFLAAGMNQNLIGDGVVVTANAMVSSGTAAGVYPLRLRNLIASDQFGNPVPLENRDGSLTISSNASGPVSGVFPQVATGGGWKTTFSLLNLASVAQSAKLTIWDGGGSPLAVPLAFSPELGLAPTNSASVEMQIPANGLAVVETEIAQTDGLMAGWARLQAPVGVVGSATFRYRLPDGRESEAVTAVEMRSPGSFVLPYDHTAGFASGIAVVNDSDDQAAEVAVTVRDASGREVRNDTLRLAVRGHSYFAVTDRYPDLAGIRGTLEFREVNGGKIALLGLRFNPSGSFSSIPAESK
ncbi:hypothetical protein [Paludibaculum fermentans]|uniref:hypothetical protein n=1 Tax=Paludibaculum fermentans TaxID=1473598 RepID=UPI003EBA96E7